MEQFFIFKKSYGFTLIKLIVVEISKMNHLKVDQIYETMNYLNVIISDKANDERWFVIHTDTIPLLMVLVQGMDFLEQQNYNFHHFS